jgi:hypothetical protein
MSIDISTVLSSGLSYLELELSVFPLAPREKKPHKQFKWEMFQHKQPSREQINSWFNGSENNNIAIATGAVSKLLVLDLDGTIAKSHAEDVIQHKIQQDTRDAVSDTLTVETGGGGLHIWIRYDPGEFQPDNTDANEIKNTVLWRGKDGHSEIRLKSDGGYVVAPPSIHPITGNAYRFIKGSSIAKLSKRQVLDLVRHFRLIDKVSRKNTEEYNKKRNSSLQKPRADIDDERIMDIVVILKPFYLKGQRNEFILYLSGWLRKEGITIDNARKIIEELAENDEELPSRLTTLQATYQKDSLDDIKGFAGLVEMLTSQLASENIARQILKETQNILLWQAKNLDNITDQDSNDIVDANRNNTEQQAESGKTKKIAKKLIDLVTANCPLLFVDQYNKPHVLEFLVLLVHSKIRYPVDLLN